MMSITTPTNTGTRMIDSALQPCNRQMHRFATVCKSAPAECRAVKKVSSAHALLAATEAPGKPQNASRRSNGRNWRGAMRIAGSRRRRVSGSKCLSETLDTSVGGRCDCLQRIAMRGQSGQRSASHAADHRSMQRRLNSAAERPSAPVTDRHFLFPPNQKESTA
jgi:hypothetical protein